MAILITKEAVDRRFYWINEVIKLTDDFDADSNRIDACLNREINDNGLPAFLDHLHLCPAIPESYGHNTSEEKLYSKYTDALISAVYSYMGLKSVVLTERSDTADVEVVGDNYSFVADAKVFRMSRTAKNQKDFKVQSMDSWKRGKPYAMIVCPLYQLPSRSSQIYQQATTRNVCIFSYSHLAVLAHLAAGERTRVAIDLLHEVFKVVQALNPSKDATDYWQAVNRTMLGYGKTIADLWKMEKMAMVESIKVSKESALAHYAARRDAIMRLTHEEALKKLVGMYKIDSCVKTIETVSDNLLMEVA